MSSLREIILRLVRSLLPKGRAFNMPQQTVDSPPSPDGFLYRLYEACSTLQATAYEDGIGLFDSQLPDNDNFTADDATNMERWLGIYSAPGTTLADRKLAIKVKLNFPGTTAPRQHYTFIEDELRAAGFDVYVYENRFDDSPPGYYTKTPDQVVGTTGSAFHGSAYHGSSYHGGGYGEKIVNYLEADKDRIFRVTNLRNTFFIGGSPLGTFAEVDAVREKEFRQLILQLKPAQSVGYLFITYV
jgi:hypothetical protein